MTTKYEHAGHQDSLTSCRERNRRVRPLFAWYDLWIGVYWDRRGRMLCVLPLPCVGFVVEFGSEARARGQDGA